MTTILVDTGPIVALLDRNDPYHRWTSDAFNKLEPPLSTCEAVLTEACHLVRRLIGGSDSVLDLVARGVLVCRFELSAEVDTLRRLMRKFADVPMSLADACLVRMAELDSAITVMTLDSDFEIYRRNRRQPIPTMMPLRSDR